MSMNPSAIKAYSNALKVANQFQDQSQKAARINQDDDQQNTFTDTLKNSLSKVNDMQGQKSQMIKEFASGKEQNVHELMITMQKAGSAMEMTAAVRNKVMEAYKKLMQTPF